MRHLLLVMAIVLTGCTTIYRHESFSEHKWARDLFECEAVSSGVPYIPAASMTPHGFADPSGGVSQGLANLGAALAYRARQEDLFDLCMKAKGYRKE